MPSFNRDDDWLYKPTCSCQRCLFITESRQKFLYQCQLLASQTQLTRQNNNEMLHFQPHQIQNQPNTINFEYFGPGIAPPPISSGLPENISRVIGNNSHFQIEQAAHLTPQAQLTCQNSSYEIIPQHISIRLILQACHN